MWWRAFFGAGHSVSIEWIAGHTPSANQVRLQGALKSTQLQEGMAALHLFSPIFFIPRGGRLSQATKTLPARVVVSLDHRKGAP